MTRDERIDPPRSSRHSSRRELLQAAAIAGASAMCGTALASPTRQNEPQMRPYPMTHTGPDQIPQRRLQTDHLDLWQVHAISFDNDPELAYAKGGIIEALDKAKKQGKTRFVGFTGHKDPSFHLRMVELGYPFDTVQMPLNPFDAN